MRYIQFIAVTAVTAAVLAAVSALAQQPSVSMEGAWSRASIGTSRPGVLYLTVTNTGPEPITLTGLETGVAENAELHRTVTDDEGVSTMKPVGDVTIAAGESLKLEPGGYHGMLMELNEPLEEGDSFIATLLFEDAQPVEVQVPVRAMTATGPES